MKSNFLSFESERLLIRPTDLSDAGFIMKLYNTPKWLKYIGDRNIKSEKQAQDFIQQKILPQFKSLGFSNYTVVRKEDNLKLGTCGLYDRQGIDGIDLGFAFLPEFEKLGFAFEASSELINASKKFFNLTELSAITNIDNHASQKLLKKLEFNFVSKIKLTNDTKDLMYFELKL